MAPRPYATITRFDTPRGPVSVRRLWAVKQNSFILVFDGPQPAVRLLLPGWKPRTESSTRTQLTPPVACGSVLAITTFFEALEPKLRKAAAGQSDAFAVSGSSPPPAPSYRTLGEAAAIVQREVATAVRSSSARTYARQWSSLLSRIPIDTPLTDLTREYLQNLVGTMVSEGLSPVTIHNLYVCLGRVMSRCVQEQVLPRDPLDTVRLPKIVKRPRTVLSVEQRDHLLEVAARDGRDIYLLISLGILAGLRRAELLAITWEDVDLRGRVLHVRNSDTFTTKSGHDGTTPICMALLSILTKFRRQTGYVVAPLRVRSGPARWCFDKTFRRVVREAGFPKLTVHGLRHSFATGMARSGVSTMKLKGWLHHSSVKTTEGYIHGLGGGYDHDIESSSG